MIISWSIKCTTFWLFRISRRQLLSFSFSEKNTYIYIHSSIYIWAHYCTIFLPFSWWLSIIKVVLAQKWLVIFSPAGKKNWDLVDVNWVRNRVHREAPNLLSLRYIHKTHKYIFLQHLHTKKTFFFMFHSFSLYASVCVYNEDGWGNGKQCHEFFLVKNPESSINSGRVELHMFTNANNNHNNNKEPSSFSSFLFSAVQIYFFIIIIIHKKPHHTAFHFCHRTNFKCFLHQKMCLLQRKTKILWKKWGARKLLSFQGYITFKLLFFTNCSSNLFPLGQKKKICLCGYLCVCLYLSSYACNTSLLSS